MSDPSEPPPPVDLSDLRMTPKWVADFGKSQPQFHTHEGEVEDRPRRDRGGRGGDERRGFGGGRGAPPRGKGPPGAGERDRRGRDRNRSEGAPSRGGPRDDRHGRGFGREHEREPRFDAPEPVQGLAVAIEPDPKAVEAMAHMIRTAGKSYSVFDAAKLVLSSGDRFEVVFSLDAPGSPKLTTVPADGSVWLSREEAMAHLMQSEASAAFYRAEQIELEEPKGIFTSVAVCGFSGELLGPPNHHSYQTALHRIHREKFAHIPFEDFKRRVRTDATPEAVEKWKESQKHGTEWIDIKAGVPEGGQARRFKSRAEVEAHFRTQYADSLLGETARATVPGNIPKKNLSPGLYFALRKAVDEARKHLLGIAQQLCAGFEKHGLKLFKRRGGKLWVSRTRPRLLDSSVVLSDRVSRIIEQVKSKPGILMKELMERVVPAHPEPSGGAASAPAESAAGGQEPVSATESEPNPLAQERIQVLKDLHWLNSEGYLIEYSDGAVFIGVIEPPPAKPKPAKPAAAESAIPEGGGEGEVADEATPAEEVGTTLPSVEEAPPIENPSSPEKVSGSTDT